MSDIKLLIGRELDALAHARRSPEAFEALFRILWLSNNAAHEGRGSSPQP